MLGVRGVLPDVSSRAGRIYIVLFSPAINFVLFCGPQGPRYRGKRTKAESIDDDFISAPRDYRTKRTSDPDSTETWDQIGGDKHQG